MGFGILWLGRGSQALGMQWPLKAMAYMGALPLPPLHGWQQGVGAHEGPSAQQVAQEQQAAAPKLVGAEGEETSSAGLPRQR